MSKDDRPKINPKKIIKVIFVILYQVLVIIALLLTLVIVLQKVSNSNKSIGGYRIFRVITGSMKPEYQVGEVVISKQISPKDIKIGDDIVYLGDRVIMHNVIGIDKEENGDLIFHAKGLQSDSFEDPNIREEQIYGIVKYKSALLTILYDLATNIYSVFFIIIVLVLNVFVAFNTPKKAKKHKVRKIANTYDELEEDIYEENYEEEIDEEIDEDMEEVEEDIEEFEEYIDEDIEDEDNT